MIPVIDIFAGPGGLGEGFSALKSKKRHAFKIVLSIEKETFAHQTLKLRSFFRQFADGDVPEPYYQFARGEISQQAMFDLLPDSAAQADREAWCAELGKTPASEVDRRVRQALGGRKPWVLIGGPPCQAYSLVGRVRMRSADRAKFESDPRHFLYREYLRILDVHKPDVFVMENVKGLLSSTVKGERIIERIVRDLQSLGYRLHSLAEPSQGDLFDGTKRVDLRKLIVKSEDYGIPQARHRVIILGVRQDHGIVPPFLCKVPVRVRMIDAIRDLPRLRSRVSKRLRSATDWAAVIRELPDDRISDRNLRQVMKKSARRLGVALPTGIEFFPSLKRPVFRRDWFYDRFLGGVCNHTTRSHLGADLQRYFFAACFAKLHGKSPTLADFPRFLLPAHENIRNNARSLIFADRFRVQVADRPATTVTSHIAKDGHYYIHPDPTQCRSLTVREAARLQTFPDNYIFLGPRTSQYQQVGNAVPPLLAAQVAIAVQCILIEAANLRKGTNGSTVAATAKLEHVADPVQGHRS